MTATYLIASQSNQELIVLDDQHRVIQSVCAMFDDELRTALHGCDWQAGVEGNEWDEACEHWNMVQRQHGRHCMIPGDFLISQFGHHTPPVDLDDMLQQAA
ncbi:hypothetical protein [Uliginosibacterium sp. H1]|uniref:hypothetical protein n=1 Tax=Uliginosibacterium sp. H1 TaxID=3114757 RepID=UPI002E19CC58|nr:hypothetical protein [Uliginosibacterium sp. H1]